MVVVDAGKSAVRCRVRPGSLDVSGPGMRPELAGREGAGDELVHNIVKLWHRTGLDGSDVGLAVIGSTFLPPPDQSSSVLAALRKPWPRARIQLMDDGVLAHAAALGSTGTVASIGTGVVVVGMDGTGQLHRIDGWGPDLGDRGSAADLGRAGLRAAVAALDGAGPATTLQSVGAQYLGGRLDLRAASHILAASDRVNRLATFAVDVCVCAHAGDKVAIELLAQAAQQAAYSCAAMAARIGSSDVVLVGRLTQDPTYSAAIRSELAGHHLRTHPWAQEPLNVPAATITAPAYRRACVAVSDADTTNGCVPIGHRQGSHIDGQR